MKKDALSFTNKTKGGTNMKRTLCLILTLILLATLAALPAQAEELQDVFCQEQGFSTKIPAGLSAAWEDGNGLRVWVDTPGYVPHLLIWRREKKLNDPVNYLNNVYREHMENTYGDQMVGTNPCKTYEIGGKTVYGARYIYNASGNRLCLFRVVEVRDDGDVEYAAKFVYGEDAAALAVLETVVKYYQTGEGKTAVTQGPAPKTGAKTLNVTPAQPILSGTKQYSDSRFSMKLPEGWQIMTQSEYMTFCFKAWDPRNPNRTIFFFMKLEPFLKSWEAKAKYKQVNDSLGGNSIYAISADAPVMESCTLKGLLDSIPQVEAFCEKYYETGLSISPSVIPQMTDVEIVERTASSLPAPATCKENIIGRITYKDYLGQSCEGLVTAQPVDMMSYDFMGVDGWPYTVYLFMGVTSPMGEMTELEPVLTECLGSFGFTESYVKKAIDLSNEQTQALLAQGRAMQAAHDAMVDAWYAREQAHDIAFQKWSDSFMGYDRLYDAGTGEVYLAELGFYDSYDLHREEYNRSNLQLVDASSQQYYLQRADYYITK